MKNLETISKEVGTETFTNWRKKAEADYKASPYLWRGEDAHHAFLYSAIMHRYNTFKELKKAIERAREIC